MEILKCMCITLRHLRRILRHKFWVAYYCFQLGLYKQGILHDLSKFGWYEFSRSVNIKGLVNLCNNFDRVIITNSYCDYGYKPSNNNLTVIDVCG